MDKTDIILPMSRTKTEDYMAQIVARTKTHEFRKRRYPATVERVWFYETAPISAITYVCEMELGSARPAQSESATPGWRLPEDGIGNREFNTYHVDWDGYDYAYRIVSCRRLQDPVSLHVLKTSYGMKSAPRGMVYTPLKLRDEVAWEAQEEVW